MRRLDSLNHALHPASDLFKVGDSFPSVVYAKTFGSPPATTSRRLIYWFSPSCHWCEENRPNIDAVARNYKKSYEVLGISSNGEDVKTYLAETALAFPVATVESGDPIVRKFGPTPTTLLVTADGKVEHVWRGAYGPSTKAEIEATLALSLPKIVNAPRIKKASAQ